MCRQRGTPPHYASSVMLLDCAKLKHWKLADDFDALFTGKREYKKWMNLGYESPASIGLLEPEWNDFDKLTPETKMIHNTRRKTQPWKSGLPVDFIPAESNLLNPAMLLNRIRRKLFGTYAFLRQLQGASGRAADAAVLRLSQGMPGERPGDRSAGQGAHGGQPCAARRVRGHQAHAADRQRPAQGGLTTPTGAPTARCSGPRPQDRGAS